MWDFAFLVGLLAFWRCRAFFFFTAMARPCNTRRFECICGDRAWWARYSPRAASAKSWCVCREAEEHPIKVAARALMKSTLIKSVILKKSNYVNFAESY
jgi:hypothetical protein